jgi:hypothetical protein
MARLPLGKRGLQYFLNSAEYYAENEWDCDLSSSNHSCQKSRSPGTPTEKKSTSWNNPQERTALILVGFITSWMFFRAKDRWSASPGGSASWAAQEESIGRIFYPQPPTTHVVPWQRSRYGRKKFQRGLGGEETEPSYKWPGMIWTVDKEVESLQETGPYFT